MSNHLEKVEEERLHTREILRPIEDPTLQGCQLQITLQTEADEQGGERMRPGETSAAIARVISSENVVLGEAHVTYDPQGEVAHRRLSGRVSLGILRENGALILGLGPKTVSLPLQLDKKCPENLVDNVALALVHGSLEAVIREGNLPLGVYGMAEVISYVLPTGLDIKKPFLNALRCLGFEEIGGITTTHPLLLNERLYRSLRVGLERVTGEVAWVEELFLQALRAYVTSRTDFRQPEQQREAFQRELGVLETRLGKKVSSKPLGEVTRTITDSFDRREFSEELIALVGLEPEVNMVIMKILEGDTEIAQRSKFKERPTLENLRQLVGKAERLEKKRAAILPRLRGEWFLKVFDTWKASQEEGDPNAAFTQSTEEVLRGIIDQFPWAEDEAMGMIDLVRQALTAETVEIEEIAGQFIGRPEARVLALRYGRTLEKPLETPSALRDAFIAGAETGLDAIRGLKLKRKESRIVGTDYSTFHAESYDLIVTRRSANKGEHYLAEVAQSGLRGERGRYQFRTVLNYNPEKALLLARFAITERETQDFTSFEVVNPNLTPERLDPLAVGWLVQSLTLNGRVIRLTTNFDLEGTYRESMIEIQERETGVGKTFAMDLIEEGISATTNRAIEKHKDASWRPEITIDTVEPVEIGGQVYFKVAIKKGTEGAVSSSFFVPTRIDLPGFIGETTPLLPQQLPTVFKKLVFRN